MKHGTALKDLYTVIDDDGGHFEPILLQALNNKEWTEVRDLLKKEKK